MSSLPLIAHPRTTYTNEIMNVNSAKSKPKLTELGSLSNILLFNKLITQDLTSLGPVFTFH